MRINRIRAGRLAILLAVLAAAAVTLAALHVTISMAVAQHRPAVHLRYEPHSLICPARDLGRHGVVYGDGHPFGVTCVKDGPVIDVWAATS